MHIILNTLKENSLNKTLKFQVVQRMTQLVMIVLLFITQLSHFVIQFSFEFPIIDKI